MNYRLLVLDLDGTVMTYALTIAPAVVQAINRAREHGVIVTLATGRVYTSAVQYLPALGIDEPIITFQGALIRDPRSGQVIDQAGLSSKQAAEALDWLRDERITTIAFHGDLTYAEHPSPELDRYLSFHPGAESDVRYVSDLRDFVEEKDPIKLLFATDPDRLDCVVSQANADLDGKVSVLRTHRYFGEVTAPGVHKGWAIERLAQHLNVPREQVVALGDQENDLPMIEWAGLGLAMASAPPSVRALADAVVPSIDEDGVARAIEQYVLDQQIG